MVEELDGWDARPRTVRALSVPSENDADPTEETLDAIKDAADETEFVDDAFEDGSPEIDEAAALDVDPSADGEVFVAVDAMTEASVAMEVGAADAAFAVAGTTDVPLVVEQSACTP